MHIPLKKLAIVIPAYKLPFFKRTIASIAAQTYKNFTLYIGNDCSNEEIGLIAEQYSSLIDIVYYRFTTNMGSQNLVAQWERCIALTQGEEWIWLFSDDDIMGERCVESFFKQLAITENAYDLYHFNVKVINGQEQILKESIYPDVINANTFYRQKAMAQIESFVVENIFSRKVYEQVGGFSKFPLAWGSDTFTWMQMMKDKGMKTISDDFVYWRSSDVNITPNRNKKVSLVKALADVELMDKAEKLLGKSTHKFNIKYLFRMLAHYCKDIGYEGIKTMICEAYQRKIINKALAVIAYTSYPILRIIKFIR